MLWDGALARDLGCFTCRLYAWVCGNGICFMWVNVCVWSIICYIFTFPLSMVPSPAATTVGFFRRLTKRTASPRHLFVWGCDAHDSEETENFTDRCRQQICKRSRQSSSSESSSAWTHGEQMGGFLDGESTKYGDGHCLDAFVFRKHTVLVSSVHAWWCSAWDRLV